MTGYPAPTGPLAWEEDLWHPDAPGILIEGIDLIHSSASLVGHDDTDADDPTFDWIVKGLPAHQLAEEPDRWRTLLIGDLFICRDDVHVSVSAVLPLILRADQLDECSGADLIERRFGFWATPLLWAFLSTEGRRQCASLGVSLDLPREAPRPRLDSELPRDSDT